MQNVSINQRVKISHNCLFGHIRSKTGEKQDFIVLFKLSDFFTAFPNIQEGEKYMSYKDAQKIKQILEEKYINAFKEDTWIKKDFIESVIKGQDPFKNIKKKDDMER